MNVTPAPRMNFYPLYSHVHEVLRLLNGQRRDILYSMMRTIKDNRGTPQANNDWSDPEEWIPQILGGAEREMAFYIWHTSAGRLSPRYVDDLWRFCFMHELFDEDTQGLLRITHKGNDFLENRIIEYVDYVEGLVNLLAIIAEHGPARRSSLVPPFAEFMRSYSEIHSPNSIETYWYHRMNNLLERNLIQRNGNIYQITPQGLAYIDQVRTHIKPSGNEIASQPLADVRHLLTKQDQEVRQQIKTALQNINPYDFEYLIKHLLEAMGYDNVKVTSKSGDGGVDVVADIQVGITSVREVVQVKRHQGNIQRPILDMLRGSLHRFNANRGTIITTGKFSRGAQDAAFEQGVAPITLIDGERLIQLLIDNEIGAVYEEIKVLKFNPDDFRFEEESVETQ